MDISVSIRQAAYYHPKKIVHNDYYLEHFDRQGKDIRNFMAAMGRENRYIADPAEENALTMGVQAAQRALEASGLAAEDIDMFVFATQTPEYTYPTNSLLLHNRLGGKHRAITMDSNANCAGMVTAVEQTSRYMRGNEQVRYALVVGCDFSSVHCNPDDEVTYANFGDAAAAVILERGGEGQGLIDSLYYTDSDLHETITFPACGSSNLYREGIQPRDIHIRWLPFDGTVCVDAAIADIRTLLERNHLTPDDISAFCLSQFSLKNIELMQEALGQSKEKFIYVGDEFGYTATSSPFIAFQRGVEDGRIRRGDYLIFWSVGAGWQIPTMLLRY
ncbi:ketoacyl-ACP synthase III [Paenibacillus spiritus]|uniref:Ketoacyl-ACP synthase III n=1 Tax=Paenibacillus spiritus TaxID=2496557 RepID=A0A5J5FXU8_9BACL|nr:MULTISPECIES: ketoacyl-ACP synthase III [Paenibacillus]KAA8998769.1 ketoacyl-ACP synthase III [Paenibacillus spiritus]